MNTRGKTLLLVDDDARVHEVISAMARRHGMIAHVVRDGRAGIAFLKEHTHVDLAIIDLLMPHVTGWDVVQFIRENPPQHTPYVVIMSGAPIQVAEENRLRSQVDALLPKQSFSIDRFDALLADAFEESDAPAHVAHDASGLCSANDC